MEDDDRDLLDGDSDGSVSSVSQDDPLCLQGEQAPVEECGPSNGTAAFGREDAERFWEEPFPHEAGYDELIQKYAAEGSEASSLLQRAAPRQSPRQCGEAREGDGADEHSDNDGSTSDGASFWDEFGYDSDGIYERDPLVRGQEEGDGGDEHSDNDRDNSDGDSFWDEFGYDSDGIYEIVN